MTFLRPNLKIFLIFFAAALAIFWPVVLGNKIFGENFVIRVSYPTFYAFGEFLHNFHASDLWLGNYISGFPVYLSQQGGHLQPLVILFFKFLVFKFFSNRIFSISCH